MLINPLPVCAPTVWIRVTLESVGVALIGCASVGMNDLF